MLLSHSLRLSRWLRRVFPLLDPATGYGEHHSISLSPRVVYRSPHRSPRPEPLTTIRRFRSRALCSTERNPMGSRDALAHAVNHPSAWACDESRVPVSRVHRRLGVEG